ncbi:NOV [Symbiodinium pilosum]|uniref:NOV protein n=1 Tax=Symbiodinium pilosum TaxID=2952 RepID=A0A812WLF1_SYMPI|nr:NOV [Symbiodinium pilosum]
MLLLPARQESQVGPQQTLFSAAQASGNAAVTELVEEAATDLLFKEISKLPLPDEDIEVGIVQQCLLAGANPTRPGGEAGYVPLQHLCVQIMPFANPKVTNRIEQAASQLTEAAPVVLMMAFTTPSQRATERVGKTTPSQESALPLEAAASNKSLGRVIVPVLSFAMARLLLQRPALAAAPLLRRAVERAHEQFPDVSFVARLVEIVRATAPCLDGASQKGKHPIWEPHCAYESWRFRERRLKVLRPLLEQCDLAQADCEREEAVARLTELEAVLERRRRQHAKEIAQLQVALQKAQRAAEEASAQAQAAQVALQTQRFSREVRAEMQASTDGKTDARVGQSLPKSASSSGSPAELLRNIRQQRGLDIDYTSVPAEVLQSASAMQRSIGAAVERLAIDLYASKGHFLLELIQNADDNRYDEQGAEPSMTLHLGSAEEVAAFACLDIVTRAASTHSDGPEGCTGIICSNWSKIIMDVLNFEPMSVNAPACAFVSGAWLASCGAHSV